MRTLTAMFDTRADAEAARRELAGAGISEDQVWLHDQSSLDRNRLGDGNDRETGESGGLWGSIKRFFGADEHGYEEGLRRGGTLLTVQVAEDQADRIITILDRDGSVDLDAREEEWRREGWSGGALTTGADHADRDLAATRREPLADSGRAAAVDTSRDRDAVIPLVEEEVRIGKREVARGGVRVRSYVVSEPVTEQVRLRDEHVEVERRPVTGASTVRPEEVDRLMQDRTIELAETREEAVVDKQAVVREEVVVHRSADERVETVSDTVRRTEVDIEDLDDRRR